MVPPWSTAVKDPIPETVTGVPAATTSGAEPGAGAVTVSVPALPVKVKVEVMPDVVPQVAVVLVVVTVS
jgi:hypothetical protein